MTRYSLGVDLGTTYSAAATVDDTGVPTMVGLGNRAMQVPSVIHVGRDGAIVVGERAERLAAADPTGVVREFKRRVGDSVPIYVGTGQFTPEALVAHLLHWVVDQTVERMGGPPERITVTHPATWTRFNLSKLRQAAEDAGLLSIDLCSEPVAAAIHYAANNAVAVGDRICIYDLGGGTFDVCVVVKTPAGFEILGMPQGAPDVGGVDFDQKIINAVHRELSAAHPGIDPDDPGFSQLRRECVDAKEALSVDVDAVIPVALEGVSTSHRLTRSEFESLIEEEIDATIAVMRNALRSAGVSPSSLSAIVLVGGSSRIPLVSEKLSHAFKSVIAVNTHPKHEVALGAALAGMLGAQPDSEREQARSGLQVGYRRRRAILSAASVVAAVLLAGLIVGRSWLVPSAAAEPSLAAAVSTMTPVTSNPAPTSAPEPTAAPSTPSALGPTQATTPTPTSTVAQAPEPRVPAPDSFDDATVSWLGTLCMGGVQLKDAEVEVGATYPNVTAAQQAYVDSYARRAVIARTTADALARTSSPVAGGRVDAAAAVTGLRDLSASLQEGGRVISDSSVRTMAELAEANTGVIEQILQNHRRVDMQFLTADEMDFVAALPGCESLGA